MKRKKRKTEFSRGLAVFVLIVIELGPFGRPFHKLGLVSHQGFQAPETIKVLGLRPRAFISFLQLGKPL